MNTKGFMLVLEGIDGAGTETQTKKLIEKLKSVGKEVLYITYPDYGHDKENPTKPIGKLIHEWLHEKYEFNEKVQFLLYSTDMVKDIEKIREAMNSEKIVIVDRYFTSTLAYQGLKGFSIENALEYAKMFGLIKPDLIIYLDICPETSLKRKYGEKAGHLDRHEKDKELFKNLINFYKQKLIKNNIFGKWIVINGEKSIDDIANEIFNIVKKEFKIK